MTVPVVYGDKLKRLLPRPRPHPEDRVSTDLCLCEECIRRCPERRVLLIQHRAELLERLSTAESLRDAGTPRRFRHRGDS